MKRLTSKQRLRHIRRQKNEANRRAKPRTRPYLQKQRSNASRSSIGALFQGNEVKTIDIPTHLDLETNCNALLELLNKVRGSLVYGKERRVFLDFSKLQHISPEAGLALLAEIDRSLHLSGGRELAGNHPINVLAASILKDMGYFRFFKVSDPPTDPTNRIFLEACTGSLTVGKVADSLIRVFENQLKFGSLTRKVLYEALIECMQNVVHHAYPSDFYTRGKLSERWWIMGYADTHSGEVTFTFLDQGVGIPVTLQKKWKQFLNNFGQIFSDSELIVEAIEEHRSRLKSIRRGNGLGVLRALVQFAPEGRFRILSQKADVTFLRHHVQPLLGRAKTPYDGTLISWTLLPKENPSLYSDLQ